jgi:hypothetical protein
MRPGAAPFASKGAGFDFCPTSMKIAHLTPPQGSAMDFSLKVREYDSRFLVLCSPVPLEDTMDEQRKYAKRISLIVFALLFIAMLFWLGIFPPGTPRIFLNQRRAAESIRNLNLAEHNHAAGHSGVGFACNLNDLGENSSVDRVLASGTKASYHFEIRCLQSGGQKATGYTITALPVEAGLTGKYALCSDQTGEIWYSESGLASDCLAMHKPIEQKYR